MDASHLIASDNKLAGLAGGEKRAAQRFALLQRCSVRSTSGQLIASCVGITFDISSVGIGIAVPHEFAAGTSLVIEALGLPGAAALEASVVRLCPLAQLWLCGCEFAAPLNDDQLRGWLAGSKAAPSIPAGR
jgi:hypothetical protein